MLKWLVKKVNNRKGFTLIELIVVIAILGILAALAIPRFTKTQTAAKLSADQATARTIASAFALAEAAGDVTRGDDAFTWSSTATAAETTLVGYDTDISRLITNKYLEKVEKPQTLTTGAFTTVLSGGDLKITDGTASATGDHILYPAP